MCSKENQTLSVNLTKHVEGLYAGNDKMLLEVSGNTYIRRHIVFMNWETVHSKAVNSPQIYL